MEVKIEVDVTFLLTYERNSTETSVDEVQQSFIMTVEVPETLIKVLRCLGNLSGKPYLHIGLSGSKTLTLKGSEIVEEE